MKFLVKSKWLSDICILPRALLLCDLCNILKHALLTPI